MPLRPDELDPAQADVYRAITGGPRGSGRAFPLTDEEGRLHGPFDAMLRSPAVGGPLQALGAALRYTSSLPAGARELAILAVAAAEDSAFERFAHEAVARAAGVPDGVVGAVAAGAPVDLDDDVERVTLATVRALLGQGQLEDDRYTEAVTVLGEQGVFELTTLVGYYRTLALQLRVFGVGAPEAAGE